MPQAGFRSAHRQRSGLLSSGFDLSVIFDEYDAPVAWGSDGVAPFVVRFPKMVERESNHAQLTRWHETKSASVTLAKAPAISASCSDCAPLILPRKDSNLQDSNLELPVKLPATSASLGPFRSAGGRLPVTIAALETPCAVIEESSMMRGEVRVLSRTWK